MTDSYTAELRDLIDHAYTVEHAGRATAPMVHASVWRDLPEHLLDYLVGKGLRGQITSYFNAKDDDGLPKRPEVNEDGEHVQLEFASVAEFAYVHMRYIDRAAANTAQAAKVRQKCLDVHGVDLATAAVAS